MPVIRIDKAEEDLAAALIEEALQDLKEKELGVSAKDDLPTLLKKHRLDTSSVLGRLSVMMDDGSDHIKARVGEMALKMNKVLTNDDVKTVPTFIININDPSHTSANEKINPILLPRELQSSI